MLAPCLGKNVFPADRTNPNTMKLDHNGNNLRRDFDSLIWATVQSVPASSCSLDVLDVSIIASLSIHLQFKELIYW